MKDNENATPPNMQMEFERRRICFLTKMAWKILSILQTTFWYFQGLKWM